MKAKLTNEIRLAMCEHPGEPVTVEDDQTQKVYVLVEQDLHQRAMAALRRQEDDFASLQRGIDQMEAGLGRPLAEVDAEIREQLGFAPKL
jgi:hypothetical protein